ncbi:MAG: TonB-dependent receptor [Elusimicrobiota bacterium]
MSQRIRRARARLFWRRGLPAALAFALAAPGALKAAGNFFEYFEEEAKVVTASRRLEPATESPVAIEIISREDIRQSGAATFWDLLRFRVGVDVVDGRSHDGNRAVVSVRGSPQSHGDYLLVLMDGRSVYSGISSGVLWQQMPVQIQDIERIEIVRGPNAALYGSNAGQGVVNIITIKPEGESVFLKTRGGSRRAMSGAGAVEHTLGDFRYRLSHTYNAHQGFSGIAGVQTSDFVLSNTSNFRGFWKTSDQTSWEIFAGGNWDTSGLGGAALAQYRTREHFQMLKANRELGPNSTLEWTGSRRDLATITDPAFGGPVATREYQYDTEALWNFSSGRNMDTTAGLSFRKTVVASEQFFGGQGSLGHYILRGFGREIIRPLERLTLIGSLALEHAYDGWMQPAWQAAALVHASPEQTIRFSCSFASLTPSVFNRHVDWAPSQGVFLAGNHDLAPSRLYNYELGYALRALRRRLSLDAGLFYMDSDGIHTSIVQSQTFIPAFSQTIFFNNSNSGDTRGAEVKLRYRPRQGLEAWANYTFTNVTDRKGDRGISESAPLHKVNFGGFVDLGRGFSASMNAGYKSGYLTACSGSVNFDVPAYWRVDGRFGWRAAPGLEIFVSGQNLTRAEHFEFSDGLKVPRTFYGGIDWKFGLTK